MNRHSTKLTIEAADQPQLYHRALLTPIGAPVAHGRAAERTLTAWARRTTRELGGDMQDILVPALAGAGAVAGSDVGLQ